MAIFVYFALMDSDKDRTRFRSKSALFSI